MTTRQVVAVSTALCSLIGAACAMSSTGSVRPPVTVSLRVGEGALIKDTPWTVIFDSVIADSRCPLGVLCIRAGEALLALELASPLADPRPQDSPHFTVGIVPATVEGFKFSVDDVQPIPRLNQAIDRQSYFVKIHIEAAAPP